MIYPIIMEYDLWRLSSRPDTRGLTAADGLTNIALEEVA
jgi:hypothetical protein